MRLYAIILVFTAFISMPSLAQSGKVFHVKSPSGKIDMEVQVGKEITWSVKHEGTLVIAPSRISMTLAGGEVLGRNVSVVNFSVNSVNGLIPTPLYKKKNVRDQYNELVLNLKGSYGLIVRAYNDGTGYRFFTKRKGTLTIQNEEANYNFNNDYSAFVPYVRDLRENDIYTSAFESHYDKLKISQFVNDSLAILPLLVELEHGKKAAIIEADLLSYPGMFLTNNPHTQTGFKGAFAPYPLEERQGGYNKMNYMVVKRATYIAKTSGTRMFPWRAIIISESDKELANNDMVQKLASPSEIKDLSWIKPGKVAWDWWNDWNITKVDFKAGINTETYKYYIDFASANNVEYVVLDEGWSERTNMLKISPQIRLQEIINYGREKNVGVILWATWYGVYTAMDEVFAKYSKMGAKGFKIDFMDRDDQKMVASLTDIAKKAADHKLILDYHGMYKPTGIQRTYPNILNFEGVKGLENVKWTPNDDMPSYDVTIPFIRMLAGPMDYTPGAMRNASKADFRPSHAMPMSQGTRCHQLAMYIVFEAPLQMMADNPTAYMKEQESTSFIAKVPTVFDQTVSLEGKVGEYVAIARKKGDEWFVGAMTNWNARELKLDFAFLGKGNFEVEVFRDGINAEKDPTDYKKEVIKLTAKDNLKVKMSNGGGWAARIYKVR